MADAGKEHGWTLIAEQEKKVGGKTIRPDGTFKDEMNLVRGYWEAKDTADKLDAEIEKKRKAGYPLNNIIFEDTATAVLYQHGQRILTADMSDPAKLAELITEFFRYVEPEIEEFEHAVDEFKERVPDLAEGLAKKIEQAHRTNPAFKQAFADFFELCQTSLNPNIAQAAVDEMLIQHILTERLIREIFDNPEFVRRNVIAAEVEKVMLAMTSHSFDRNTYLRDLDRFYVAIEHAARTMTDWSDKQYFLNTVYERFFQGYSVKLADTMGIVYTPQEIVDFMCAVGGRGAGEGVRQEALERRRLHHRPLHRDRQLHRQPHPPHPQGQAGGRLQAPALRQRGTNRRENITDLVRSSSASTTRTSDRRQTRQEPRGSAFPGGTWERELVNQQVGHLPLRLWPAAPSGYRTKYADNLKRELPRIPFAPDFRAFAKAGEKLAKLHLDYEKLQPWELEFVETPGVPLSYRVEDKMRLAKDKLRLAVNPSLTLAGIPPEAFEYRLGNRSAVEWVIDQYQVSTDKRSGITSDPNREDDPEYIVRLVGQVVRVSLETVKIVKGLPAEFEPRGDEAGASG